MGNLWKTTVFSIVLLALFHPGLLYSIENKDDFFKHCPPFHCGKLREIGFPFTSRTEDFNCGPYVVDGCDNDQPKMKAIGEPQKWYKVENLSQLPLGDNITVTDTDLQKQLSTRSCESFHNLSLPHFELYKIIPKPITMFKCNSSLESSSHHFDSDYRECPNFHIYYNKTDMSLPPSTTPPNCSVIMLPAKVQNGNGNIFELLSATFSLHVILSVDCYLCLLKEGKCQQNMGEFKCLNDKGMEIPIYVQHPALPSNSTETKKPPAFPPHPAETKKDWKWKLALIAAFSVAGIGLLMIIIYCYGRKFSFKNFILCSEKKRGDHQSMESFLRNNGLMALKRYKYTEVKKMTFSFKDKLGEGGYGSVFKGNLPDGCPVAVKVLKDSKSSAQDFINEVASISRTSHVNVVTLLGFCFEGSKRTLIYEFMSNGSLDKYSHKDHQLDWETLYQIAIGIARGLEYLHRGCNTRILHLDIKPHNILLDENFIPKISDFGLARICIRKESMISVTGPRGTAGYIAPEVFSRCFGRVSHKSDVYSYGMLVLEMVGGKKNMTPSDDHSGEIYFPDWIFKRLEQEKELGFHGIRNEEDEQIGRKMVVVSLWCIQTDPSNRPAISRVIEMMEGSNESLPIPPKPYLVSPER